MKNFGVKINYLYNSGFAVETEHYFMVFDYFKDEADKGDRTLSNGVIGEKELKTDKNVIVFSSHSHADHFNPVILEWNKVRKDLDYVLSSDIELKEEYQNVSFISAYEELDVQGARIKAYGSTDIGISFLVIVDGLTIFHAGDLNWWYWWDDTEEEIKKAEQLFKAEIEKIKGETVDIAFFPVDSRLEHNYYLGAKYFVEAVGARVLIPMHFGENYKTTVEFRDIAASLPVEIITISRRGQEINL